MSILLDQLIEESKEMSAKTLIDGKWYNAMPIQTTGIFALFTKIKDAIKVVKGQAFAYHYKEQEDEE